MSFNYSKLRGKIIEVCGTQAKFSTELGIGRVSLSKRLNNQLQFSNEEIMRACTILKIDKMDIPEYFFTEKV